MSETAPVVSAHAVDFVWRAGGTIALHAEAGYDVTIVSFPRLGAAKARAENDTITRPKFPAGELGPDSYGTRECL